VSMSVESFSVNSVLVSVTLLSFFISVEFFKTKTWYYSIQYLWKNDCINYFSTLKNCFVHNSYMFESYKTLFAVNSWPQVHHAKSTLMGKQWNEYTKNCAYQHALHLTQQQNMYIHSCLKKIATLVSFALSITRTF
jgi:hypothetical protein